jgi:NADH:ubiquinone oxidoreductase subunit F (NADH-binding)
MNDASFCGLGQTAAAALNSAWKHFKEEFEANVRHDDAKHTSDGGEK